MLTQEMINVLLIALVANAIVVAAVLVWTAVRRRTRKGADADLDSTAQLPGAHVPSTRGAPATDAMAAEAGEPWFLNPSFAATAHGERPWAPAGSGAGASSVAAPPHMPPMATPATWATWLDDEAVRVARYHRPATIALVELAGLDRLAERVGRAAADRLIPPIAATIRRHARASDRLAHLAEARFGILLIETDEVSAINFVERIRSQCDVWLAAGAVTLRLSVGWAEIGAAGYEVALREAEDRLFNDRRRSEPAELPALTVGREGLSTVFQGTGS